jgi:hypothetical protein
MTTALATAAGKPRPLRRAFGAVQVPIGQHDAWHRLAAATAGLSDRELRVLVRLCQHFKELAEKGQASALSYERMAHDLDIEPDHVRGAMYVLVEKGLVGYVKRGAGRSHSYAMRLPKRLAASLAAAPMAVAGDDDDLPPF